MHSLYRGNEQRVVNDLLPEARVSAAVSAGARTRAHALILGIRSAQTGSGGLDALLNEFSLSSEEGIVLMCLAEALLRVPDKKTADRLIQDKLVQGDWSSHLGQSESLFVNASAWGLLLTGKLVSHKKTEPAQQEGLLKRTLNRLGEPVIRASVRYAMQIMGAQFVMGKNIGAALARAKKLQARGYRYSYDMLGEGARTQAAADCYWQSYQDAIHAIGRASDGRGVVASPSISVKLSALHPRFEFSQRQRVMNELVPQLKKLALLAKQYNIGFTVDAEEAERLELSLEVIEALFIDKDLTGWEGFGLAIQAYQKRALLVVEWAATLSEKVGRKIMVRLVKGAYWDSEIKWSQQAGLQDYPVFTRKAATDVSYQACAKKLLASREFIYPQFATHNAYTVATILEMDDGVLHSRRQGYEFQRLHGMGEALYDQVLERESISCRIYAPVGEHKDLLAYLVRRLLENGANSSFVNNIVDESVPLESMLKDPVAEVESWPTKRNVAIPLPLNIYSESVHEAGQRDNSKGLELSDVAALKPLKSAMDAWWLAYQKQPSSGMSITAAAAPKMVINPANLSESIAQLHYATPESIEYSLAQAHTAFSSWSARPVAQRAELLRRLADALETHHAELMVLCSKEAGKTIVDGLAEVREAVDFCRYYADRAEELMANRAEELMSDNRLKARGVILCISPWNFPLAIFIGQVTAALVVGNTVVAKAAEQTSLIAQQVVALMHECGFPKGVVELVVGPGKPVGEQLLPDSRIQGVLFTGSTATGLWLSKALAQRGDVGVPLIAETGGQNTMIVDSTALPEQVVHDVLQSAFQSAGQRCSALRVLFVQEDIADEIIAMIRGAMDELQIGDPSLLETDVGPVIDSNALTRLYEHVAYLNQTPRAKLLHVCRLPEHCTAGHFFAPCLFELENLSILKQEVFGPVLHIVRFGAGDLDQLVDQINNLGFGLTLGVHSRIQQVCQRVAARAKVGNVYINRNIIGAVVGVQPFGGCGLSGTGPKAGGPHYLKRLVCAEQARHSQPVTNASISTEVLKELREIPTVNKALVSKHLAAQGLWSATPLAERLSILRALLNLLALGQQTLAEDVASDIVALLQPLLKLSAAQLGERKELPGPTGETNYLAARARGTMAVILADDVDFSVSVCSLLTTLLAGNSVVWLVGTQHWSNAEKLRVLFYHAGLNLDCLCLQPMAKAENVLSHKGIAGVVTSSESAAARWAQATLAERDGALLPLVLETDLALMLPRLMIEKTTTTDTTSAGGNAALMTMTSQ